MGESSLVQSFIGKILTLSISFLLLPFCAISQPGLRFIENNGQWPRQVLYAAEIPGGKLFIERNRLVYNFVESSMQAHLHDHNSSDGIKNTALSTEDLLQNHAFELKFSNSNMNVVAEGSQAYATKYNYIRGRDPEKWISSARAFSHIELRNIYDGVDMKIYSNGHQLKYDLVVHPNGNTRDIRLRYKGLEGLSMDNGNIYMLTTLGSLMERKPYAYQMIDGHHKEVPCLFRLERDELMFDLPKGYKRRETLVIDPEVIFSAYSGSVSDNWGYTATFDAQANVYSGGIVRSSGYPVTMGAYQSTSAGGTWDIGIMKFDSVGNSLLYATYLGGSETDTPQSLFVNNDGELLILGTTSSTDFPVTNGTDFNGGTAFEPLGGEDYNNGSDIFVAKLSADGSNLLASTYLGGSDNDGINFISGEYGGGFPFGGSTAIESPLARNYGDQFRGDIITDSVDNVYIASNTASADFPIIGTSSTYHGGSHDAVLVKLTSDLSEIIWSLFLGGSGTDAAYSLKLDSSNNTFIAGGTDSNDFAGINGFQSGNSGDIDGWVASIAADGNSVINATYIGTSAYDQAYFVDINLDEEVYLYGQTQGDYPVSGDVYSETNGGQFIHKLSNDLQSSMFSTVFGSGGNTPDISPTAFLVSECNKIYLAGWGGRQNGASDNFVGGNTTGLRVSEDAFQSDTEGDDFYLMVLDEDASAFLYGTFLGGGRSATHVDGGTSRFDKRGTVYHSVCAGCGGYSDFPAVNAPTGHRTNGATATRTTNGCNNVVFKFDLAVLSANIRTNSVSRNDPGIDTLCYPDAIVLENRSSGAKYYVWDLGDGTVLERQDTSSITHFFEPGVYTVTLTAYNDETCEGSAVDQVTISVFDPGITFGSGGDICYGDSYGLVANGGFSYLWETEDGEFVSTARNPLVEPLDTTTYFGTVTHSSGCIAEDSITVNVIPPPQYDYSIEKQQNCDTRPSIKLSYIQNDSYEYSWDLGNSTRTSESDLIYDYEQDGDYVITLNASNGQCQYKETTSLNVMTVFVPNVFTPDNGDDKNPKFEIQGPRPYNLKIVNRLGKLVYENSNYQNDWSGSNVNSGVFYYYVEIEDEAICKGWLHVLK